MIEAIWVTKTEWVEEMQEWLEQLPVIVYDARTDEPAFVILPPLDGIVNALVAGEKDEKE